jgi:multiple sugar transport system substrate-binding protein
MKTGMSAGFLSAAMAAPGPVRSYLLGSAAAQTALPVGDAANVVVWTYRPDIVSDNLTIWAETNGQPTPRFADIPGIYDYANVIAGKFIGGEKIDMMYCHSDQLNRWYRAGWIRDDLESLDWVQTLKSRLQPWGVENMSSSEGKLLGLPYWAGTKYLIFNDLDFEKAGITAPPLTWEEFEEQCAALQAAGVQHPYVPYWRKDFWALGWSIFVESYSDGDYIFDDEQNLTVLDGDTPFRNMLERWRRMYEAGIVPPNAFEIGDPTIEFNTGNHSFCMNDDYSHKRNNDPELSLIAGHAHNMLNPGLTHETTAISPMYVFGKNSNLAPETQNDLAQYFGSTYHDGEYKVASRWVLEEGLGSIDTELMAREDVRASFSEWRDVDLYDQQLALAKPRNVHRQLWYPEWELNMIGKVQEFVLGSIEIGDVLSSMGETLDGLKQQYPSI